MKKQLKIGFLFTLMSTVGLGIIYPILLTGVGFFIPSLSSPSFVTKPIQSASLFQNRPSMSEDPYSSGASNLSLTSLKLHEQMTERLKYLAKDRSDVVVPRDLIFASASGCDPDISVEGAMYQIGRISKERRIDIETLKHLVEQHTQAKLFGFIGAQRVNVIELNKSLKKLSAKFKSSAGFGTFRTKR
jgi:K+-transporting ATPase ATPase C chain